MHRRRTKHVAAQRRSCDPSPDVDVIAWKMAKRWCLPAKFPRALRAVDVVCTSSRQGLLRLCALRCNTFEANKLKLMCVGMKHGRRRAAALLLLGAAATSLAGATELAAGVSASPPVALAAFSAPLPSDGAIGPSGGCEHNAGPSGRGESAAGGAVGGGGTEGTTGMAGDDGCPSGQGTVSGARGPAGPEIDASTTGPTSLPPSGIG